PSLRNRRVGRPTRPSSPSVEARHAQAELGHPFGEASIPHTAKAINMSANCATWNSERIELLKRCFHAGLSCSQIAREIGVTRNAVIGKMNRLGLSRPKDVIGRQLERGRAARPARPKTPGTWHPKP